MSGKLAGTNFFFGWKNNGKTQPKRIAHWKLGIWANHGRLHDLSQEAEADSQLASRNIALWVRSFSQGNTDGLVIRSIYQHVGYQFLTYTHVSLINLILQSCHFSTFSPTQLSICLCVHSRKQHSKLGSCIHQQMDHQEHSKATMTHMWTFVQRRMDGSRGRWIVG